MYRDAIPRVPTGTWTRLWLLAGALLLSGCMAMQLSSRGAPGERLEEIVLKLDAGDLPASHGHHAAGVLVDPYWLTFPESGWIHGWDYSMVDAAGDTVHRDALHHFRVLDPDRRELFGPIMMSVVGAGSETTPVMLPNQVGYRVEAGDSLLVTAMLHNPTHETVHGVVVEVTLRYSPEPAGRWTEPLGIMPFHVHVAPTLGGGASYDLPPGRSQKTADVAPAVDAKVLALGAHLHRYGVSLTVQDLSDGRVVWQVESKRAPDGTVLEIRQDHFVWSAGPTLKADRTYRLIAVYDNPTGESIVDGGMATLGGIVVPEAGWPEVDRTHPEYQDFLAGELRSGPMTHGSEPMTHGSESTTHGSESMTSRTEFMTHGEES